MTFLDPEYASLTSEQLSLIDQICGKYEQRRLAGTATRIEDLVAGAPEPMRAVLEYELIRVELEIAAAWHQLPTLSDLRARFPNSATRIEKDWSQWGLESRSSKLRSRPETSAQSHRETKNQAGQPTPVGDFDSATTPPRPSIQSDSDLRFRILRRIAEGGIGTVYAAFDNDLQREVALKELKRSLVSQTALVSRFLLEATITSHLEHPNIVPIYAVGRREDGRHFYAMRLIQGNSMQVAIAALHQGSTSSEHREIDFRSNPAARDMLIRFIAVCRAIGFAHSRGVIHRDIKPGNIMLGDFGETLIVDWGLARKTSADSSDAGDPAPDPIAKNWPENSVSDDALPESSTNDNAHHTREGTIVGTPGYMSPEQATGQIELTSAASDVYSLGATLFCLLTNSVPIEHTGDIDSPGTPRISSEQATQSLREFRADTNTVIHVGGSVRSRSHCSPRTIVPSVPAALDAICRRAMEDRSELRYASAENLAADVEAWLADQPVSVMPESRFQKARRWLKGRPVFAGTMLGSVAIAVIAMAVTLQILAEKNRNISQSLDRETKANQNAQEQATLAAKNAEDAEKQRQRIQEILHSFITDVERSLTNVPGSAVVRKRVLTQVLNQLGVVSDSVRGNSAASLSSVMALTDLADLFAQFGPDDVNGSIKFGDMESASPSEAALRLYGEAMLVVDSLLTEDPDDLKTILEKTNIQYKQASLLRQIGKTADAMQLISVCSETREKYRAANPESLDWAMAAAIAQDLVGQIHLQNGELDEAETKFLVAQKCLEPFRDQFQKNEDLLRRVGILVSRLGDIAAKRGDLEKAESFYAEDARYSEQLAKANPENLTAQRDHSTAIDRLGNMRSARGQLQEALEFYLSSRKIREEILLADPGDQNSLRELFVSFMKCGDARMMLKLVSEAKADFISAGETADKMAVIDPKSTVARRFQSFSAEMLADIALAEDDFDNALKYAVRSLEVSLELAAIDPLDGRAQQDVLICHTKVAKVHLAKNDTVAAIAQYRLAEGIANQKYQQNPSLDATTDVIYVRAKIAETYLKTEDYTQADENLKSAITLLEAIPVENRSDANLRRRMVNLPTLRAQALIKLQRPDEARTLLEQAKALALNMIQKEERAEQMKLDLQDIEGLLRSLAVP